MADRRTWRRADTPYPPDAQPCVWMTAGLLTFCLCDRNYDCEHCALDAAFRRRQSKSVPVPKVAARWEFPPDRAYHGSHGWVRATNRRTARWGLDAFAAWLLGRAVSVVLPAIGGEVAQGQTACWIVDGTEPIPLSAPISGIIVAVNREVQRDPGLIVESPYERGWLAELRCPLGVDEQPDLVDAAAQQRASERQRDALYRRMARRGKTDADLGPTLPDGGEPMIEWRRILGPRRYNRVVRSLLG